MKTNNKSTINTVTIAIGAIATAIIACSLVLYYLMTKPADEPSKKNPAPKPLAVQEEIPESVEYKIEKDELSFENTEQDLYLTQYFEKVVITDEGETFKKINALIQKQSDRFIDDSKENESFVKDESYMSNMHYSNYCSAAVTKNSDGILSIKMTRTWFMGGVSNIDSYGLNYNLKTGEELNIAEFLGMTKTETENFFKEESKKQIKEGFFEDAAKTIDNYSLSDFNYYIKNDSIFLCHSTYSLAPGAAGEIIMEIPIPSTPEKAEE